MMVVTAKLKKRNILILGAALIAIILVLFWPSGKEDTQQVPTLSVSTNEGRIAFLNDLGWEVVETPTETQQIVIPAEENEVFTRYNELQKAQGYDLNKFAGKVAKRYVYEVTNHPDNEQTYYATLLICKDKIIGGDVASSSTGGKMHTMQFPQVHSTT